MEVVSKEVMGVCGCGAATMRLRMMIGFAEQKSCTGNQRGIPLGTSP